MDLHSSYRRACASLSQVSQHCDRRTTGSGKAPGSGQAPATRQALREDSMRRLSAARAHCGMEKIVSHGEIPAIGGRTSWAGRCTCPRCRECNMSRDTLFETYNFI